MSTRERWIVYPLLFLALGMVFRERFSRQFQAASGDIAVRRIRCEELQVDRLLCNNAEVRQTAQCGQAVCQALVIQGSTGRPVVLAGTDKRSQNGIVEVLAANGSPLVRLQSTPAGGLVTVLNDLKKAIVMGWAGKTCGVFAEASEDGRLLPLTKPGRVDAGSPSKPDGKNKQTAPAPSKGAHEHPRAEDKASQ